MIAKNETIRKIWKNDDGTWTGYELTETFVDGQALVNPASEKHLHFQTETEAQKWQRNSL